MSNEKLSIKKVDKYNAGWESTSLYTGFRIRAILAHYDDAVTEIQQSHLMRRKLRKEFGTEGEDWMIVNNFHQGTTDLYLKNTGKLLLWKLQDAESFGKLFDSVEQHVDDLNEIREQQSE